MLRLTHWPTMISPVPFEIAVSRRGQRRPGTTKFEPPRVPGWANGWAYVAEAAEPQLQRDEKGLEWRLPFAPDPVTRLERISWPPLSDTGTETGGGGAAALLLAGFDRPASGGRIGASGESAARSCAPPSDGDRLVHGELPRCPGGPEARRRPLQRIAVHAAGEHRTPHAIPRSRSRPILVRSGQISERSDLSAQGLTGSWTASNWSCVMPANLMPIPTAGLAPPSSGTATVLESRAYGYASGGLCRPIRSAAPASRAGKPTPTERPSACGSDLRAARGVGWTSVMRVPARAA